jgi:hypothetical protein
MCQTNAMRFGHEANEMSVPVEAPGTPLCRYLDARLIMAIEQLIRDFACRVFVSEFKRL